MSWLKVYYRDGDGVMRSLNGVRVLVGTVVRRPAMIYLDQSVYTLTSQAGARYWFDHFERGMK